MSRRALGIIVVVAGAILMLIAALADVIGIGDASEFGLRQWSGVVVGLLAIIIGGQAAKGPRA
ncbi:MAG TPA: hypothetical protein VJ482_02000 [Acidimicrobiia bacterium]|nr:hypothetical protein [Acidimicrobiia bacterium]